MLILHINGNLAELGYNVEEILLCLRVSVVNEMSQVRSGGFRAIRHVLTTEEDVWYFNELLFPALITRSFDLLLKNEIERIEAMKLIRKVLFLSPSNFDITMSRSLVSLANGGIEEKDRLLRATLATLSELCVLNTDIFISSGGVAAITRNLLECQTPKIAESLCGVLLLLLDKPATRQSAAVDLHCVAAPYCDFHYRHGWMDKNRDERELRFNCSRLAMLSLLLSWPGILHFCSPHDNSGFKAIVQVLYLNQLEVRKAVLDLMYELLGLPQPEWTDELSVALSAVDPAEPQASWRLYEGFVVAEGRSVLPHLARTTPSISDMHLSLLLYCFLEAGLLEALAEVVVTSDTFISVRATVLLGELLRLIQILLPPECCNISPALPNLLEYAVTNKPQALRAITALQQLHKLLKRRPASYSLYLDHILQSGNFIKASNKVEYSKKYKVSSSKSKLSQLVLKDGDDQIRETGVLANTDILSWNWNLIKVIVRNEISLKLDMTETNHRNFLKRLVEFYTPSSKLYSHMDLSTSKNAQGYTAVGIDLIYCLLRLADPFCTKLLLDFFKDISANVGAITLSKSPHDCLFNPQHMMNTQCQTYFLFIGRLDSTREGAKLLSDIKMFDQLELLATTTNHACYVKLIISSLDYKIVSIEENKEPKSHKILSAVLTCPNESSRLYATQFLLVLLRAGLPHFCNWGIKLLARQLQDKSRTIYLSALSTLHEACEIPACLENLVKLNPDLLHLGEKDKNDFLINEIVRWDKGLNFRYVKMVEGEISDALTLHQRGEDGRYDKRSSSIRSTTRKEIFLPPHIYGQLSKHEEGFQMLLDNGSIDKFLQHIESGHCETDDDILNIKSSLWAVGHLGSSSMGSDLLSTRNALALMVHLAENCDVYSVRATAFYSLGLVASTKNGADSLFKLHWVCTRHDRHDRWPIIEEENWEDESILEHTLNPTISSDSEKSSDRFIVYIEETDSSITTEDDLLFMGDPEFLHDHKKSSTLPNNQSSSLIQHKRSLSESKTYELIGTHEHRSKDRLTTDIPHRHRENSGTESTSGVGSSESVVGKSLRNDRTQTLSPIPSSSSLITIKTEKYGRNSDSSKRFSMQSITPSDRSTVSPPSSSCGKLSYQDRVGYQIIRELQSSNELAEYLMGRQYPMWDNERKMPYKYVDHSKNYVNEYMTSYIRRLNPISTRNKDQCYMGVCLPLELGNLFPKDSSTYKRLISSEESLEHVNEKENRMMSSPKPPHSLKHDSKTCFSCSKIRQNLRLSSYAGDSNDRDKSPEREWTEGTDTDTALKYDIVKQIERLANPLLLKPAKQVLLLHKQRHPHIFHDICLYSEVCKIVSQNSYRLGPRRLIQELFLDVNFESLHSDLHSILCNQGKKLTITPPNTATVSEQKSHAAEMDASIAQRRIELSQKPKTTVVLLSKNVKRGFNVEGQTSIDVKLTDTFNTGMIETRSPPLQMVAEESWMSTDNLMSQSSCIKQQTATSTHKTDIKPTQVPVNRKSLDSIKFTYNENKFPIKNRDDKNVIK
ncbi:Rapamycin-insensitive companion of mTOR, middle domain [Popillia japonica]|uniref:Rapamycin-insensitive companion of mTOR, middle domain n=1 Tax=Popillia japonica TaxID=7064 RepID=A0AAW1J1E7_POPJA